MTDIERAHITARETGARQTLTPHGQAQRDALVDAAYHLIAEGGFEHLRTREVAARAGVNIATLHYYFATKEDLIRAVVARLVGEFKTIHAPTQDERQTTPVALLRGELLDMRYHMAHMPETYSVLLELSSRALHDPAIQNIVIQMDHGWRGYIEELLLSGVRQGSLRVDLDVAVVASALVAFLKGACMEMMTEPDTFDVDRILAELERGLLRDAAHSPTDE
ncbi:MAG: TetR/AcrR family transcriptional regulator [Ktedonobacterales bacterium]